MGTERHLQGDARKCSRAGGLQERQALPVSVVYV